MMKVGGAGGAGGVASRLTTTATGRTVGRFCARRGGAAHQQRRSYHPYPWSVPPFSLDLELQELKQAREHLEQERYHKAITPLERSLQILEPALGKEHPSVKECHAQLALAFASTGDKARGERHLSRWPANNKDIAALDRHFVFYRNLGDHQKALSYAQQALEQCEKRFSSAPYSEDEQQRTRARYWSDIGTMMLMLDRKKEGETLLEKGLALFSDPSSTNDNDPLNALIHGGLLNNIALVHYLLHNDSKGQQLFQQSISTYKQHLPSSNKQQNNNSKEEASIETRALQRELMGGLYNLAHALSHHNQQYDAEDTLNEALKLADAKLGETHPSIALFLALLGRVYARSNRPLYAEGIWKKGLMLLSSSSSSSALEQHNSLLLSPALRRVREEMVNDYAMLLKQMGRSQLAEELQQKYASPATKKEDVLREKEGFFPLHVHWHPFLALPSASASPPSL
ncbi:hypothetical protein QOT17_013012 [Balamuthia mandrillaris]